MNFIKPFILGVTTLVLTTVPCGITQSNVNIDNKHNNPTKIITPISDVVPNKMNTVNIVNQGQKFAVVLEQNPSTGYTWSFTTDCKNIELVNEKNIITKNHLAGAPSYKVWTFVANKKGTCKLKFSYARPWEKNISPIKKVEYSIEVN